jgi:tetratricopeptide (TPR) repeat protein
MRVILLLIVLAILLRLALQFWSRKGHRAIARGIRTISAINGVMAAYREGDYETGLQKAEGLKQGFTKTAEYCFFRGSMLHHLCRLEESEASLREGLPLEEEPSRRALVYNTLAEVLMDQGRYPEAIAFYENAGRAWPDRGGNHRGIAKVWLRQRREFAEALEHARQAVEIDRKASGLKKEALDTRLGEDLATLAWAVAANASLQSAPQSSASSAAAEVESLLKEAFQLCDARTKPILAQIHYQAGKAYEALAMKEKTSENFRRAAELDPKGTYGRLARASAG